MKKCSRCREEKVIDEFYAWKRSKDGHLSACKDCTRKANAAWNKAHPEVISTANTKWRSENRDVCTNIALEWQKEFPAKNSATVARRHAKKMQASPDWADQKLIQAKYDLAARMTKVTGNKWEVDHIIPLIHPLICGLHVENNLQVISKSRNCRKSNKWTGDIESQLSL